MLYVDHFPFYTNLGKKIKYCSAILWYFLNHIHYLEQTFTRYLKID